MGSRRVVDAEAERGWTAWVWRPPYSALPLARAPAIPALIPGVNSTPLVFPVNFPRPGMHTWLKRER